MNCEWVKNNGTLYMYDELPDDARYELEQHVARCESCAKEVAELREVHAAMSVDQVREPSPSFVADSRMKFEEALEHVMLADLNHEMAHHDRNGHESIISSIKPAISKPATRVAEGVR